MSTESLLRYEDLQHTNERWGIVGYRRYNDYKEFKRYIYGQCIRRGIPKKIISGGAAGTDTLAVLFAKEHSIEYEEFKPDFSNGYNENEYFKRNQYIVDSSDILLAFVSEESKGTIDTINKAKRARKEICIFNI
jgi:uncharacterized phage-like protein YoqJ